MWDEIKLKRKEKKFQKGKGEEEERKTSNSFRVLTTGQLLTGCELKRRPEE